MGANKEHFATFKVKEGSERFWCREHFPRTVIDIRAPDYAGTFYNVFDADGVEINEQILRTVKESGEVLCHELKDGRAFEDPDNPGTIKTVTKWFKPPLRHVKI